ncbi:uncharacterized protein EV420DRAFT_1748749 [Desarmillaria tabescens]|uniref:Uncharacterized protein n=1 Tax=Armillaria tabescens TaxID=1929756 RepID=A0AA39KC24_ARMTA|nr:uncharacterized protein EV420DRAFT_1748749 [Desarmillaria tabescens]KAK0457215.1 hypothetical protein EV420DRAFT_1748749 [Desarmillaria tabescens]
MLLRPLSLVLPVALAIANPFVGRSEVTALQEACNKINTTLYDVIKACNAFSINVDSAHAEEVFNLSKTLQSRVRDASEVVPDALDGKWLCESYTNVSSPGLQLSEDFIALKKDFQSVDLLNDTCLLLQKSSKGSALLDRKLLDATPDSWKACVQRYQEISENMTAKVLEAYCGHS